MATGEWHPIRLEEVLLKLSGSYHVATGKLRRLVQGMPAGKPGVMEIQRALPAHPIVYWANHPVFHLLDVELNSPTFDQVLMYALNSVSGPIRRHLWPGLSGEQAGTADARFAPIPDLTALSNALGDTDEWGRLGDLDKLTLSLATRQLAERARNLRIALKAAKLTLPSFLAAMLRHQPLLVSHQDLIQVMIDRVWGPMGDDDIASGIPKVLVILQDSLQSELKLSDEMMHLSGLRPRVGPVPRKSRRATRPRPSY